MVGENKDPQTEGEKKTARAGNIVEFYSPCG